MPYIICFIISTLFIYGATKKYKCYFHNDKKVKLMIYEKVMLLIGILIPCILAALRDISVGSDVSFYVMPYFNRAIISSNFMSYVKSTGSSDIGYLLLNYLVSRLTDSIGWLFFIIEFIILLCIFIGFWNFREKIQPWKCMIFFYLIFYNMTLSTVRQCIAIAICFCAVSFVIANQFKKRAFIKAVILIGIATTFHSTALITVLLILVSYLLYFNKISQYQVVLIGVFLGIIIRIGANYFISIVSKIASLFSIKYANWKFLSVEGAGARGYLTVILLSVIVCIFNWIIIQKVNDFHWKALYRILFSLNIIYLFGMMFISNITFVPRMLYYIQVMWCLPLGDVNVLFKKDRTNQVLGFFMVVFLVFMYWLYFFCISNVHGTFPYLKR